jgi:hypothetical protein
MALAEIADADGAWLALPVGQGKTLISYLAAVVLHSTRSLLIVPANLVEKTSRSFGDFAAHWQSPSPLPRVVSRESLALEANEGLIPLMGPDLIIVDEADDLRNHRAAAVKRIDRYIRSAPHVRVVCMTGTPGRLSIMDYWHQVCWCLCDGAPVPLRESEARVWAMALDESRGRAPVARPGVLGGTQTLARAWYRRRLSETRGVLIVDEDSCDAPLTVRLRLARECPETDAAFATFAKEQETPGGQVVSDGLSRWRLDSQLGLGFYTRWDPEPPEDWRDARRASARFVREKIDGSARSSRPLDTEAQVFRRHREDPIVERWLRLKGTFDESQTVTEWLSRAAIQSCVDWLQEYPGPTIVWTGSVDFALALSTATGLPYYGRAGQCEASGLGILDADPTRPMIVSWGANKRGFDLQAWGRHLVTMPPQSAKWIEQLIGRSHRAGREDPVVVDVLATSGGTLDLFDLALGEAAFNRETLTLTQKTLRATIVLAQPTVTPRNRYRWARRSKSS